jgi:hypothetical protein
MAAGTKLRVTSMKRSIGPPAVTGRLLRPIGAVLAKLGRPRFNRKQRAMQIAETLAVAERTAERDWEKARAILAAALK